MLELARKEHPDKKFSCLPAGRPLEEKVDIIFEVNCLHSFGMTREEFFAYYRDYAKVAVICIERNGINVEWVYEKTDRELSERK